MRNLKRALSLALASVMLLGMMVVGSSAAFADADEIVNTEAVEITAGLGLFAGSDGKFNPKGTVTRAQMATVIAKMLYGSEINADQFKGTGKFSDTAAFEGGWAEGYINLCANLGIVGGYGDGTYKPGQAVTTAEAVTMIINALDVDAGAGTWPMTVMAKAEEIELFKDMEGVKPGTNMAMTRDQLAVTVWNGLNYSAEGVKGYSVTGSNIVFDSWADAAAYADKAITDGEGNANWTPTDIQPIKNDTLAKTVFELAAPVTGYITENQATGGDCTIINDTLKVDLETGLDMLGHFVTVYYSEAFQNEKKPGVAYCLVEAAEYVEVAEKIDEDRKDYLAAFGTKVETDAIAIMSFDGAAEAPEAVDYDEDDYTADAGTYVIDNETGKIRAFIAPVSYAVKQVGRVVTTAGKEAIKIGTVSYDNTEDNDVIVEYDGIAEDDVVVVKNYDGVIYVTKAEIVSGKVTKTQTKDGKDYTYIDGTAYVNSGKDVEGILTAPEGIAASNEFTYDAYIYNGKLLGLIETAGAATLSDTIYVVGAYERAVAGTYADSTNYYAQGIDAEGKEVSILIGVDDLGETTIEEGFYTFKKSTVKEEAKKDIMVATGAEDAESFNEDTDKFYTAELTGTENAGELKKADKYVFIGGGTAAANRVYLTANTKFVVIDKDTVGDELEVVTYTGSIAKTIDEEDIITVAVSLDANDNKLAEMVVINTAAVSLKAEDYIFVVDADDYSAVKDGYEYNVFFTSTNEFKTIISNVEVEAGFYGDYTIDEDGIYDLGETDAYADILAEQIFSGVFGETNISSDDIDLYDAANAVIVDIRGEDVIEDSEVAEIETLKDIISANKAKYQVVFTAIVDDVDTDEPVVTHIFVTGINLPDYDENDEIVGWIPEA